MREQDFERSVQKKMEELSFTPSVPVWEQVEKEIRTRRERRRLLLWCLPLMLMLGGGWWFLQSGSLQSRSASETDLAKTEAQNPSIVYKNQNKSTNNSKPVAGEPKGTTDIAATPVSTTKGTINTNIPNPEKKPVAKGKTNKRTTDAENHLTPYSKKEKNTSPFSQSANVTGLVKNTPKNENEGSNSLITQPDLSRPVQQVPLFLAQKGDALLEVKAAGKLNWPLTSTNIVNGKRSGYWQWGIQLAYGQSRLSQGSFLPSARMADQSSAAPPFTNAPGASMAPTPTRMVDPGNYLAAGIRLRKPMRSGLAIATGLQYARYTQKQKVGAAVSLTAIPGNIAFSSLRGNTLFRDTLHSNYFQNRYHQLSIPVELQVAPFRRLPLQATAGLSLGYLVAAKELQYDPNTRLYFETKPYLQRLQLLSQAALHYRFAPSKKLEVLAGPQVHYHLNAFKNSSLYAPSRLFAYSLDLQFRLK